MKTRDYLAISHHRKCEDCGVLFIITAKERLDTKDSLYKCHDCRCKPETGTEPVDAMFVRSTNGGPNYQSVITESIPKFKKI